MIISVQVKTNSKSNKIILSDNQVLKIHLKATPIEGQANKALVKFLSKELNIAASFIDIKKGLSSKHKLLDIQIQENDWKNFLDTLNKPL